MRPNRPARPGPALLAVACVALAVGAPVVLVGMSRAIRMATGVALRPILLPGKLTVIPAHTNFSGFSPTYLAVFLLVVMIVPILIYRAGRPRAGSDVAPVWDGGIIAFKPRMQYSAMTFSAPTRVTSRRYTGRRVGPSRVRRPAGHPACALRVGGDAGLRTLSLPAGGPSVEWLADLIRPLQSGDVNLYLLYVFIAVLVAYLIVAV